jgi:hypothetical protein
VPPFQSDEFKRQRALRRETDEDFAFIGYSVELGPVVSMDESLAASGFRFGAFYRGRATRFHFISFLFKFINKNLFV